MQRFFDQRPIARGGKSLEFRSLPLAQCELRVVVPKLSATRVPIVPLTAAGPTDLKDVFVSAAGAARITLSFPEGAPEGGVRVSILRKTGDFPGPDDEVVSVKELLAPGKDARLDLRKLDPGLVVIAISGISTDLYRTVDASIRPDILTEVAVTLDPIVVRGTVTRGKSPVEVAKLELVQTKKVASATSDKDGLYRLLVWTSGVYMLLTTPPAENFAFPETLDVENTAEVEHDVVLPFSSIMGTVTDKETGAPIPKARLTASPAEEGEVGFSFGVDSDDEGSYRFGNLTDRVLKIKVEAEGYSSESFDSVRPAEGGTRLDVTLSGGLTLRGQVVDDVGRPIAGAFVGLDSDSTDSVFSRRTETSGDGSFSFDGLRRGGHLLVVHRCGYRMGVRALDLMPSTEQLQLALSTASVSITFRFRDDRNRPVPRVAVGVSVDGRHLPREYPSQFSMGCGLSPFSDGDGLLRVDLLPLGSLEILVGAEQRPAGSIVNEGFERSFDLTIASGLP